MATSAEIRISGVPERRELLRAAQEGTVSGVTASIDLCDHLAAAQPTTPRVEGVCEDCVALGERSWVHLRTCLSCGHVGCCDSSPRRHASAHFAEVGHPVVQSAEPGELWRWCFVDERLG